MTVGKGHEGQPVRLRGAVPRAGQPGADGVRHEGPAVGRRVADLSALEAEGADERQAPDPRRHRRRRQGRQDARRSPTTCTTRPASSSGTAACSSRRRPDLLFLKDTDGDDKADVRERDRPRPRLGRHASHGEQLRARSGRRRSTSRKARSTTRRSRRPTGPPVRLRQRAASSATSRGRRSSTSTSRTASPIRTATSSTAGARTSSSTAPGRSPYHARALLRPRRLPAQARAGRRRSTSSGRGPAPAWSILSQPALPRRSAGQPARRQRASASRASCGTRSSDDGASFGGDGARADPVVAATRTSARPTSKIGPDGAIYFIDWQNPIIGHMQHNLRDPSRDRDARPRLPRDLRGPRRCSKPPKIAGEPIEKLLDLLKEPEDRVRYRARIELSGRKTDEVIAAAKKWIAGARQERPELRAPRARRRCGCISTTTSSTSTLLKRVLASPDFRARAAATRVLCYWRDRVPERARPAARSWRPTSTRACGSKRSGRPASSPCPRRSRSSLIAAGQADRPVPRLRPRRDDEDARPDREEGDRRRASRSSSRPTPGPGTSSRTSRTDDLLKMERTPGVYLELLFRPGVRDEVRREAVAGLAKLDKKTELAVLLDAIKRARRSQPTTDESVVFDLVAAAHRPPRSRTGRGRGPSSRSWPPTAKQPRRRGRSATSR